MVRAVSKATTAARKKRTRKLTKGFRLGRHNLYRQAIVTLIRRGRSRSATAGRRSASSAGCGSSASTPPAGCGGMRYSEFMHGLQLAMVTLDRKSLSEIAIHDPATFDKLVEIARSAIPAPAK